MRILLIGNPNVGKSVVFNRLTGAHVITSNYPGTTVEFTKGYTLVGGERVEVIDVPGTYTLEPTCKAEEIACRFVEEGLEGDVYVNVVDSTKLERSLNLTLDVLKLRRPVVLALNFWDDTLHTGININLDKLEEMLGVPCVPTVAITGEGIKNLVERLPEAKISTLEFEDGHRWNEIGRIIVAVQTVSHRHHSLLERLGDASVKPFPGLIIALIVIAGAFELIRFVGEGLIGYVFDPLFENLWAPVMMKLSGFLGSEGLLHNLLVGELIEGEISFGESFGLLTTGFYVPIASVLPYVLVFYFVLSFLEDSGYLPRLAVLLDSIMHSLGLHGMAIVPMMLGLGCNVPGALATRIMESKRERFIAATLMAICVPCMAQTAMIIGLAGSYGAAALLPIFGTLFLSWLVIGSLLRRFVKGESPEILIDVPPYRIPYMRGLLKKLWLRIIWFLKEAVPFVLLGVLIVNFLYMFGIIGFIGSLTAPVVKGILGLPEEAVGGLVVGFLRKDVAVGMLMPLKLSLSQIVVACVVLTMYFPCVATFAVMLRELGVIAVIKSAALMVLSALVVGGLLNLAFQLFELL